MLARCKAGALERWYAGVLDSQRTVRLAIWGAGMLGHWHFGRPLRSEAGEVESWLTIHPQSVRHLHRRAQGVYS